MSHIFISYSRKDLNFAQKIVDALAANNLDTWIDWKSIPKGEEWEQEIYRGIEEADSFLFLVSPDSIASEMCNKEIAHAVKNGKRILPIILRDTESKGIPAEISKRNWIFCRDGQDDFSKAIEEMRTTIHTDYEWLKYHTELQVKALKWEQNKDVSRLLRGKELREAEERVAGAGSQKDPQPTELHRSYILTSQRNEVRQRRQVTIVLGIGLTIVAAIAVFAWVQRNEAQRREVIARSGELATQALLAEREDPVLLERSMLLAIEAKKQGEIVGIDPIQANQVLHDGLNLLARLSIETEVYSFKFPDHVHSGFTFSSDNSRAILADDSIRSIELATNNESMPVKYEPSWRAVSFSNDGRYAATVSENNLIQVWELDSGKELARIASNREIYHIYFAAGKKYIIAQTSMIEQQIWELSKNGAYSALDHLPSASAVLSWDGRYLIDQLTDEVRVWSMQNRMEIADLKLDIKGGLYRLDISSGSKYILTYDLVGQTTQVWQLPEGKEIMRVTMNAGENSTPFMFSPDERYLAVVSNNQVARVWDIGSGEEILRIKISPVLNTPAFGEVRFYDLAFSQDGQALAVAGDNLVRVYNVPAGEEIKRIVYENDETSVRTPIFSFDGRYLAVVSQTGIATPNLDIWNISHSSVVDSVEGFVNFIDISSNQKYIAIDTHTEGVQNTILQVKNTKTLHEILSIDKPRDDFWNSPFSRESIQIFSPNGLYCAVRQDDGTIQIFELRNGKPIAKIVTTKAFNSNYVFSQDNRSLITLEDEDLSHTIRTWDIQSGNLISSITTSSKTYDVLLSPDGGHYLAYRPGIVTNSDLDSGYLSLRNISDDKEVTRMNLEKDFQLHNILFSPDGNLVAAIGFFEYTGTATRSSRYIKVWDALSSAAIVSLTLDRDARGIALSHDGKYLAASLIDGTYRVWQLNPFSEIIRVPNKGTNYFIKFTSDSKYLATIESIHDSATNSYRSVVDLTPLQPENEACSLLTRNLTEEEWNQYLYWTPYNPEYKTCPNLPIQTK